MRIFMAVMLSVLVWSLIVVLAAVPGVLAAFGIYSIRRIGGRIDLGEPVYCRSSLTRSIVCDAGAF